MDEQPKGFIAFLIPAILTVGGILSFLTGTIIFLHTIVNLEQGTIITLTGLCIGLSITSFNCYKAYKGILKKYGELKRNRDGLIEAKNRYLDENEELKEKLSKIENSYSQLAISLDVKNTYIFNIINNIPNTYITRESKEVLLREFQDINFIKGDETTDEFDGRERV